MRHVESNQTFHADKLSGGEGLSKAFPALEHDAGRADTAQLGASVTQGTAIAGYVLASAATHTRPDDEVIGVIYNGKARVYPTWAAHHYHIINDVWDQHPLLVDT